MAIHALVSPGGSPGVTTTAVALALTWPRPVILAECDPGCGDILAGLFAGHLAASRGLLGLAFEAVRNSASLAAELEGQLMPLDGSGQQRFLAGINDPRQAPGLGTAWHSIAAAFASQDADVIADCGRLGAGDGQPLAVLTEAACVVMVMRPSLRQVARAKPRIEMLSQLLDGPERIRILLIGDRGHKLGEISETLGVPVLAQLPDDPKTAAVLSDGEGRRTRLSDKPLMRAAKVAGLAIDKIGPPAAADLADARWDGARWDGAQ
jgi:hypothetical protein